MQAKRSHYIYKMSIRHLKLPLCVCVCCGGNSICVFACGAHSSSRVCGHFPWTGKKEQSFLKISALSNCLRLSKKRAGIRWVNMSTVYNYSPVSTKIQQIIAMDDSRMNHCIQKTRRLSVHISSGKEEVKLSVTK